MDLRKSIALDAYEAGYGSNDAARISGLSAGYIRHLTKDLGISRPRGRPLKIDQRGRFA